MSILWNTEWKCSLASVISHMHFESQKNYLCYQCSRNWKCSLLLPTLWYSVSYFSEDTTSVSMADVQILSISPHFPAASSPWLTTGRTVVLLHSYKVSDEWKEHNNKHQRRSIWMYGKFLAQHKKTQDIHCQVLPNLHSSEENLIKDNKYRCHESSSQTYHIYKKIHRCFIGHYGIFYG